MEESTIKRQKIELKSESESDSNSALTLVSASCLANSKIDSNSDLNMDLRMYERLRNESTVYGVFYIVDGQRYFVLRRSIFRMIYIMRHVNTLPTLKSRNIKESKLEKILFIIKLCPRYPIIVDHLSKLMSDMRGVNNHRINICYINRLIDAETVDLPKMVKEVNRIGLKYEIDCWVDREYL